MYKLLVFLCASFMLLSLSAIGQQNSNRNSNTNVNDYTQDDYTQTTTNSLLVLEHDSEEKEFLLDIPDGAKHIQILVDGLVTSGKLVVEIYDPRNKKQGNFSLGTSKQSKSAQAQGNLSKSVKDPLPGQWKIRIIPEKVTGQININFATA